MSLEKILIVDDDKNICDLLRLYLEKEGFGVILSHNGEEAVMKFHALKPDIVLLDIMLPGLDGWQVCREIRKKSNVPIIMITAKSETFDKVLGLELGADDYITKPFSTRELMARVKANLRRVAANNTMKSQKVLKFGDLEIDIDRYEVKREGKVIELTLREFELVKFLALQHGQIFSRETLLEKVWGYEYYGDVRTVDVTVRRVREKMEKNPSAPAYILTKRGVGYYFNKQDS